MMGVEGAIGAWIKDRRKALDWTQAELGNRVSCSAEYIRKIEQGTRRPSKATARLLADALRIAPDQREWFIAATRALSVETRTGSDLIETPALPARMPVKLIGREHELAQAAEMLANPDCRLMTIFGPGGIGKTALALSAASDQAAGFRDGITAVMLTAVQSAALLPCRLAEALGIPDGEDCDLLVEVLAYLRERQLLLVLDGFEHLLNAANMITRILAAAREVKVLVTSRERLKLSEEWVLDLPGLTYPEENEPASESHAAVELFCRHARRIVSGFSLSDQAAAVGAICWQVRGLPLAVEMAASWLRYQSCQEIAGQLGRDRLALTSTHRDVLSRHRGMSAVIDDSWRLLSDREQHAMMRLSMLAEQFVTTAALEKAGVSYETLLTLVDKSLLHRTEHGDWAMHPIIREYAARQRIEAETEGSNRHLEHYVRRSMNCSLQISTTSQAS